MPDADPIPETSTAPSPTVAPSPDDQAIQAILLGWLAGGHDRRRTRGDLKPKLTTKAAQQKGLTADSAQTLLERLEAKGFVQIARANRTTTYTLTDAGEAHLGTLDGPPMSGRGRIIAAKNDDIRRYRNDYLLLAALRAPEQTVADSSAGEMLDSYARDFLDLNVATARHLLKELESQHLLNRSGTGRLIQYKLTADGRTRLANARFHPSHEFRLGGDVLSALLDAAKEVGKQFEPTADERTTPIQSADLEHAIQEAFDELLRERHAVNGMVPIHEVRAEVRRRLGERAVRHDMFDAVIIGMRQGGQFRLMPITDRSRASAEELQASIPGTGETLFYLEAAHEPVAR